MCPFPLALRRGTETLLAISGGVTKATLGLLALPQERRGNGTASGKPQIPTSHSPTPAWSPCPASPPFQVQIEGLQLRESRPQVPACRPPPPENTTASQPLLLQTPQPRGPRTPPLSTPPCPAEHHSRKGLPPCPQSTTGHLFGGGRGSLLLSPNPPGWSRDHPGRSHQQESPQQGPVQHPEQRAQFSSKARSRAGVTVNADPGPRRWEPPKRASAQRGRDSDPPPHLPQPSPPASPPTSKVEV